MYQYSSHYSEEEIKSTVTDTALIFRLLTYLKPYTWTIAIAVFLLLVAKGIEAYVPILIGQYSQMILDYSSQDGMLHNIVSGCIWVIVLLSFGVLLEIGNMVMKNWIAQNALFKLRADVFNHVQSLPVSYYDKNSVGRLMTRTIHDVDQINQMFSESVIPLIGSVFLFLCVSFGVFTLSWRLAFAFFISLPMIWYVAHNFRRGQRRAYSQFRKIVSALNTFVQEHLMGASTIRQFNRQEGEYQKFKHINNDYSTAYLETGHHFALLFSSIDFVQSFVLVLVFSLLVSSAEGFQGGEFFTFSLYIIMIFRPIGDLAERYNVLQSAFTAAERIFNILDEDVEYSNHVEKHIGEVKKIEFENVWFAYKNDEWVLKDVSFTVAKGETVALVGMTGSGKTTIINLLLRYYEIEKGSIKINGRDIRDYPLHALRTAMAIVLQDPVIFSGTIAENVSLHIDSITAEDVEKALDYANMSPLVRRYPEGINHKVAERGMGLSAGEKQLLSLARAVAHQRSVLILDEATANIDATTERAIQEALERILKSTTSIVIAHRLSTIHRADKILVVHRGIICEMGTHRELIDKKGIYEKLYRLQYSSFGSIV